MANTTNFGWETPDDTDLVKDGAAAIRTLGGAIDTSLVDLKGGTTDQVLAKNSNTDMDFKWVTSDDANAIQNAIVDAKGDLIAASAADTPARLAVGNNGETLVANSSASVGLSYQSNFAAGKNKIINGAFDIWQRGTTFNSLADGTFTADRYKHSHNGNGTFNVTRETFTPGSAPVAGYEGTFFYKNTCASLGTSTYSDIQQQIEDVRVFAGQTITVSFWLKTNAARTVNIYYGQLFGSGGSAAVYTQAPDITSSTSWTRHSVTVAIPSITGKTIGTSSSGVLIIRIPVAASATFEIWGVQVEAGSVATAFQTATGTLAGELAACQRYYVRFTGDGLYTAYGHGYAYSTTGAAMFIPLPVTMRVKPSALEYSTLGLSIETVSTTAITNLVFSTASVSQNCGAINATVASGLTTNRPYSLTNNNSNTAYLGFSAEL